MFICFSSKWTGGTERFKVLMAEAPWHCKWKSFAKIGALFNRNEALRSPITSSEVAVVFWGILKLSCRIVWVCLHFVCFSPLSLGCLCPPFFPKPFWVCLLLSCCLSTQRQLELTLYGGILQLMSGQKARTSGKKGPPWKRLQPGRKGTHLGFCREGTRLKNSKNHQKSRLSMFVG